MAKGDSDRAQSQINYRGNMAQNELNNTRTNITRQNEDFWNNYKGAVDQNKTDYGNIMGQYQGFADQAKGIGLNPEFKNNLSNAASGYANFATTGGFSPRDIQDIRERSIAPTRAAYNQGIAEVQRQGALSGATNAPAAIAQMTRNQGYALSDANTNANAAIAQLKQQGQLAGLGGLESTGATGLQAALQADALRNQMGLNAIQGQGALYGTAPGMASVFGNQALGSSGQYIDTQQLQNQLALGLIGSQINKGQIPGNFQQGLQNAGSLAGLIGKGAGIFTGFGGGFTGLGNIPNYGPGY